MRKKVFCLAITLFVCVFFLISCSSNKEPANLAIKAAETTINTTKAQAAKIVPDEVKSLEDSLAVVKEKFVKKDYKAALEEATALDAKAKQVLAAAKTKKAELTKKWTEATQELSKMLEDITAKVDVLSKAKKLPKTLTKEKFEEAKAGFASAKDELTKAQASFTSGNLNEAVGVAASLKDKVLKIMESLGMSTPIVAPAVAPVAAPSPSTK
jgi:hypothetical protein